VSIGKKQEIFGDNNILKVKYPNFIGDVRVAILA
jgi:hypothetical protein